MSEYKCIVSGSLSQNNIRFRENQNVQCVAISCIAGVVAKSFTCREITPELLDQLVIDGDKYYTLTKTKLGPSHTERFLTVDEVERTVQFKNEHFNVQTQWVSSGLYPTTHCSYDSALNDLENSLVAAFNQNSACSYVFVGLNAAVSFWKDGDSFLLFNSHSVNKNGTYCRTGVCRLFNCTNLSALCRLLFIHLPDGIHPKEYEITRVTITRNASQSMVLATESYSNLVNDPKLKIKCVVLLEDKIGSSSKSSIFSLHKELSTPGRKNKRGRPLKKHRGRPKTHSLPQTEQQSNTSKNYISTLPGIPSKTLPTDSQDPKLQMSCVVVLQDCVSHTTQNKPGRPKKKKPGCPKTSSLTREEQQAIASKCYAETNPHINLIAVTRYADKHPNLHRECVEKYTDKNPGVNHRAVTLYADTHKGRHLPVQMRKGKLIAEFTSEQLNTISQYRLKNPSLRSDNCFRCSKCGARLFEEERTRLNWCCGQGRYNVVQLPPLDQPFYSDKRFLEHSSRFNSLFQFCALVVPQGFHQLRKGLSFLKILGRVYYKAFDLLSNGPYSNTAFMCIDDGEERLKQAQNLRLDGNLVLMIQRYLASVSPLVPLFKMLYNEPSENACLIFEETTRRTHGPVLGDRPQSTEVAAVISCENEPFSPRQICIWKKGNDRPHYINAFHHMIDPLLYPLLFPHGKLLPLGEWIDNRGCKMTRIKLVRYLLLAHERFSKFGRLSETWQVENFCRIDEARLRFIRNSQRGQPFGGLRSAPFDEIGSVLNNGSLPPTETGRKPNQCADILADETVQGDGSIIPGRIILPGSYTGGPRHMKLCYLNAMALVARLGGPTYFLTFTAFGGWDEIKQSKHTESKSDAMVCDRVFKIKLLELLRDIRCGRFFGILSYIVYVIEFQMRGLPHAHICFRVDGGGPVQNKEIDLIVRADIPAEHEANGRLRQLVLKHMIHGPCNPKYRVDLPCWDRQLNKCTKFFPKPHNETTHVDSKGFVNYRRNMSNKVTIRFRGAPLEIDDRWVVPYNPALLLKYACHINLEIASASRAVKYLFKYISKGGALRRVSVVPEDRLLDEIEEYVTKRYISASDAVWRILEFNLTGRHPPVSVLPVHLEGKHNVLFRPGTEAEKLNSATSLLLVYFARPKLPEMDSLSYLDFYETFIVHTRKPRTTSVRIYEHEDGVHFSTRRQRSDCVARLFWVAPNRGEQYFLRMLLAKFPCHSYSDLYLLGGHDCTTFQQAARAVGLLEDNNEYIEAFNEASKFMEAHKLRNFLVLLCTIGAPTADLWDAFKGSLSEDFLIHFPQDEEMAFNLSLVQIDRCLRHHGLSLTEVGLPFVEDDSTELSREQQKYDPKEQEIFFKEWECHMSSDQIQLVNYCKSLLHYPDSGKKKSLYLDGPGGYGKTLLLKVIAAYFRSQKENVICVATSGIAALNFSGGTTAHSTFRLPLDIDGTGNWCITNGSQRAELIRKSSLIIFDEAPMCHRYLIEMLDRSLQDLMSNHHLFGGKIIIFAGDFRQIPPVVQNAKTPSDVINVSIRCSYIWGLLKIFHLTIPKRTRDEVEYSNFLLDIGQNSIDPCIIGEGRDREVLIPLEPVSFVTSVQDLIDFVFPSNILTDPDSCSNRAVLCTHNANVKEINESIMTSLPNELQELNSYDSVAQDDGAEIFIDISHLHHAQGKGVPDHILRVKVGAICVIMRNLNFDLGLVNGTKVIIFSITRWLVTVRKPGSDELFGIPRITFKFPVFHNSSLLMYRRQFPLQLCYAVSIHKSQGQTIDIVGVDLRSDCFTHGQLYVALSRVTSPKHIKILVAPQHIIDSVAYAKNIVFQNLL